VVPNTSSLSDKSFEASSANVPVTPATAASPPVAIHITTGNERPPYARVPVLLALAESAGFVRTAGARRGSSGLSLARSRLTLSDSLPATSTTLVAEV
jgi:hypothetical protein